MRTFAPTIERESVGRRLSKLKFALVQLVRIHACHAWGHGFESRTHRKSFPIYQNYWCVSSVIEYMPVTYGAGSESHTHPQVFDLLKLLVR